MRLMFWHYCLLPLFLKSVYQEKGYWITNISVYEQHSPLTFTGLLSVHCLAHGPMYVQGMLLVHFHSQFGGLNDFCFGYVVRTSLFPHFHSVRKLWQCDIICRVGLGQEHRKSPLIYKWLLSNEEIKPGAFSVVRLQVFYKAEFMKRDNRNLLKRSFYMHTLTVLKGANKPNWFNETQWNTQKK